MDRTDIVPPHRGPNILPWSPLFTQLLRHASRSPPRLAVRDVHTTREADYLQLIADVLHLRSRLLGTLPKGAIARLDRDEEVFISILASGSYQYSLGVLAISACGAAVVPISVALSPAEALYYASKSRSVVILYADGYEANATSVAKQAGGLTTLAIHPSCFTPRLEPDSIFISSDRTPDPNAAGVVIFTSGTTGPPKASVMRRKHSYDEAQGVAEFYGITSSDVLLHCLPVHHATGVGMMHYPFLYAGACIEFRSGSFDPAWTWERFRRKGITYFSAVPTIYMRMKRYFEEQIVGGADERAYVTGARSLKVCMCGTSALPKPISDFWTGILGKKIMLRYGGTEFGAVLRYRPGDDNTPDGSVGRVLPGVEVKLAGGGDEGEVLTKGPWMFARYLDDPEQTRKAHDEQGFFKTGDIARREGQYYWILGRASVDILKTGGYKVSALDVERELLSLPYIQEVSVVGVEDEEFGQRIAAALVPSTGEQVTLQRIRRDLKDRLAGYKSPTLLRLVEGELPKSATGKVVKKTLGPALFPAKYRQIKEVQVWDPRPGNARPSKL